MTEEEARAALNGARPPQSFCGYESAKAAVEQLKLLRVEAVGDNKRWFRDENLRLAAAVKFFAPGEFLRLIVELKEKKRDFPFSHWLDAVEEIEGRERERQGKPEASAEAPGQRFFTENGATWQAWHDSEGNFKPRMLANFAAEIVADITKDDGADAVHFLEIEAAAGERKARFTVPNSQFSLMKWPLEQLGARAIITAGAGIPDLLREAVQALSREPGARTIYTHAGWRIEDGRAMFLHADGAIGGANIITEFVDSKLACLRLPQPATGAELRRAIKASLNLYHLASARIMAPAYGAIWSAPIVDCNFTVFLRGRTGKHKTATALLLQKHYGEGFEEPNLCSWESTDNALEMALFTAKDSLLVIDDFQHKLARQDRMYNARAERILREQANRSARGRLRADTTQRPGRPPRGLLVATGEDCPGVPSLLVRMAPVDVNDGDIDKKKLSACQAEQHLYCVAMSGYLAWIAPHYKKLHARLAREIPALRDKLREGTEHARLPDVSARLLLGFGTFLVFATKQKALSMKQATKLFERAGAGLLATRAEQNREQDDAGAVERFFAVLTSGLHTGKAYLAKLPIKWDTYASEHAVADKKICIGWEDEAIGYVYLDYVSAYRFAQQNSPDEGGIGNSRTMLGKQLHDSGALIRSDKKRKTLYVRKQIGKDQSIRAWLVDAARVLGGKEKLTKLPTAPPKLTSKNARFSGIFKQIVGFVGNVSL